MQKYKYRKLSGKINEVFESRKNFAKALETSEVTVSNKMNGISGFSQKDIEKWAELLGIPVEEYGIYFFA